MIDDAPDCLLGFYAICVFVVLKFEGVLNGALCLCEGESLLFWNPTFVMVEKEDKGRNYHFKVMDASHVGINHVAQMVLYGQK